MAKKQDLTFIGCPLEVRHEVYGYVCKREEDPQNLLRDWFGRKELKENAANTANTAQQPTDGDEEDAEEGDEEAESMEDEEMDDDDGDGEDGDGDGDGDGNLNTATAPTTTTTTAPATPQISRKWRHVPGIMSLTASPPPLSLLQTCKQLYTEANDYFYDTAILRINCTSGFNHMAYFEELMNTLASTAFSPAESIRKVELTFVWDSQWLRARDVFNHVFVALLRERARLVASVLTQTPALKELKIVWHDSVEDNESALLREGVMEEFYGLRDRVKPDVDLHYDLEEGEEPGEETVLGQMRLQLEEAADACTQGRAF
jgi:hypothetical protein